MCNVEIVKTRLRRAKGVSANYFVVHRDVVEMKPEPGRCLFVRFRDGAYVHVHLAAEELTAFRHRWLMRNSLMEPVWIRARLHGPVKLILHPMSCMPKSHGRSHPGLTGSCCGKTGGAMPPPAHSSFLVQFY